MRNVIGREAINRRKWWISEIQKLSYGGDFKANFSKLEKILDKEVGRDAAISKIIEHLRLCGDIPESYTHDSSEEKLYSKYTDALLAQAFNKIGLKSLVLETRADSADVEVVAGTYSFVADAKAFRLSRTAKNQKDFKVQAMDGWRGGHDYAMVVCPIYQLPRKNSQIYEQAITRHVCVFTYSHLSVLVTLATPSLLGKRATIVLIETIFKDIITLNPSKDATTYWSVINGRMLGAHPKIADLWRIEKLAAKESITIAKQNALDHLQKMRLRIMRMTHKQALKELLKISKVENKIKTINSVSYVDILGAGER